MLGLSWWHDGGWLAGWDRRVGKRARQASALSFVMAWRHGEMAWVGFMDSFCFAPILATSLEGYNTLGLYWDGLLDLLFGKEPGVCLYG